MTHPGILAAKGIRPREGSLFGDTVSTIVQFNVQDKSVLYGMPLEPQIVYLRRMPGSFQIHHKSPNRPKHFRLPAAALWHVRTSTSLSLRLRQGHLCRRRTNMIFKYPPTDPCTKHRGSSSLLGWGWSLSVVVAVCKTSFLGTSYHHMLYQLCLFLSCVPLRFLSLVSVPYPLAKIKARREVIRRSSASTDNTGEIRSSSTISEESLLSKIAAK